MTAQRNACREEGAGWQIDDVIEHMMARRHAYLWEDWRDEGILWSALGFLDSLCEGMGPLPVHQIRSVEGGGVVMSRSHPPGQGEHACPATVTQGHVRHARDPAYKVGGNAG